MGEKVINVQSYIDWANAVSDAITDTISDLKTGEVYCDAINKIKEGFIKDDKIIRGKDISSKESKKNLKYVKKFFDKQKIEYDEDSLDAIKDGDEKSNYIFADWFWDYFKANASQDVMEEINEKMEEQVKEREEKNILPMEIKFIDEIGNEQEYDDEITIDDAKKGDENKGQTESKVTEILEATPETVNETGENSAAAILKIGEEGIPDEALADFEASKANTVEEMIPDLGTSEIPEQRKEQRLLKDSSGSEDDVSEIVSKVGSLIDSVINGSDKSLEEEIPPQEQPDSVTKSLEEEIPPPEKPDSATYDFPEVQHETLGDENSETIYEMLDRFMESQEEEALSKNRKSKQRQDKSDHSTKYLMIYILIALTVICLYLRGIYRCHLSKNQKKTISTWLMQKKKRLVCCTKHLFSCFGW